MLPYTTRAIEGAKLNRILHHENCRRSGLGENLSQEVPYAAFEDRLVVCIGNVAV